MSYPTNLDLPFNEREIKIGERHMRGFLFAFFGGALITLQGVANS